MHRIHQFVLALGTALVLLATPAFATTAWASSYRVSNQPDLRFGQLSATASYAENGTVITMLEDSTPADSFTNSYYVQVKDVNVTLDLGGHVLTVDGYRNNASDYYGIQVQKGTVTIKNGTIRSTSNHPDPINAVGGTIILEKDVKVESVTSAIQAANQGKVIIDGAQVSTTSATYAAAFATGAGSSIELKSGSISQTSRGIGSTAAPVTLSVKDGASVTISGGSLYSGSSSAMMVSGAGSLVTITGGKVSNDGTNGSRTGVNGYWVGTATDQGRIVVKGGEVSSDKGNGLLATSDSTGGTVEVSGGSLSVGTTGYAIAARGPRQAGSKVVISDGSLRGTVAVGVGSGDAGISSMTITGGTVDGVVTKAAGTISISGGIFTEGVDKTYCAEGYLPISTNNQSKPTEVKVVKAWDVTVSVAPEVTYTGEPLKPEVTVKSKSTGADIAPSAYEVTYANNVEVGTATVIVTCKEGADAGSPVESTFKVVPRHVLAKASDATKVYGEEDPALTATFGKVDGVTESGLASGHTASATVSRDAGEDVGTYQLTLGSAVVKDAQGKDVTANYQVDSASEAGKLSITKADAKVTTAPKAIEGLSYTGEPQVLVEAGTAEGGELQYSLDGESYSAELPKATDAGSYTVHYRVVGDKNHNDTKPATLTASITKADAEVTAAPKAIEGLVYTGEPQVLIEAGTAEGGELQYSLDGESYSAELPQATDAGTYTVYYRVVSDAAHGGTDPETIEAVIAKCPLTVAANDATTTYGDEAADAGVSFTGPISDEEAAKLNESIVYSIDYELYGNVGQYQITVTGITDPNYDVEYQPGTLTVVQRPLTFTWPSDEESTFAYRGEQISMTATAVTVNDDALTLAYEGNTATETGDYVARVTGFTGNKAGNYVLKDDEPTATHAWRIGKQPLNLKVTLEDWTYGKQPNSPVVTASPNPADLQVTFEYCPAGITGADDGSAYTQEVPTEAGSYTVRATVKETEFYEGSVAYDDFQIHPANIVIIADDKVSNWGSVPLELTYHVTGDYVEGDDLGVKLESAAYESIEWGVYPITISWNGNPNYVAELREGAYTLLHALIDVSATGYVGTYDGLAHGIAVEVSNGDGADPGATIWYAEEPISIDNYWAAGSTNPVTRVDAGTTTVYYFVIYGKEYVFGSQDIAIAKAPMPTVHEDDHPVAVEGLVENDSAQELVRAPEHFTTIGLESIEYSVSDQEDWSAWSEDIPARTEYGTYAVRYRFVGDKNHESREGGVLYVTIAPVGGAGGEEGPEPAPEPGPAPSGDQDVAPAPAEQETQPSGGQDAGKSSSGAQATTAKGAETKAAKAGLPRTGDATSQQAPLFALLGLAFVSAGMLRRKIAR